VEGELSILGKKLSFPDPLSAREDGLLAIGGDLKADRLLLAYREGIFPWSVNPITWWSPDPRSILPLESFHVPRRIERIIRQGRFEVTWNQDFEGVMRGCAKPRRDQSGTWISSLFIKAYGELHHLGHAHSIECRREGKLVGGVYGVAVGGLFAGESMFHEESNASSVALVTLLETCRSAGYVLFDTQMATLHTRRFGAIDIPREEYLKRLRAALEICPTPLPLRKIPSALRRI